MNVLLKATLAAATMATAAQATPVTFEFAGSNNQFNFGLPGNGPWSASITIDPSVPTATNTSYRGSIVGVDLTINGFEFEAVPSVACSTDVFCNSVNPVQLAGGRDAFIANFEGDFVSPAGQALLATEIFLDFRTDFDIFSDIDNLFDVLTPGQTVGLLVDDDNPFSTTFSLSVSYEGGSGLDGTTLNTTDANFVGLTVPQGDMAPVPLPAGLPLLMAGIGGLVWVRRRQR